MRGLLAHEDSGYREWSASGTLRITSGTAGRGLSLSLVPPWGAATSGVAGLWSREATSGLASFGNTCDPAGRLGAEVGYGLPAFIDTGLPARYGGTVPAEGADRNYRVGTRWICVTGLTLNVEGIRHNP